ncbi:putative succinate dehydrogenase (quinone) [Helianthus anomalus]
MILNSEYAYSLYIQFLFNILSRYHNQIHLISCVGSCGEGCILRNEDERFIKRYTPPMKDLASQYVSRFTIMKYKTMCA